MWATVAPKCLSLSCFNVFYWQTEKSNGLELSKGLLWVCSWLQEDREFIHEYFLVRHELWVIRKHWLTPLSRQLQIQESSGITICAKARSRHISPSPLPKGKPQPEHRGCKHHLVTEEKNAGLPHLSSHNPEAWWGSELLSHTPTRTPLSANYDGLRRWWYSVVYILIHSILMVKMLTSKTKIQVQSLQTLKSTSLCYCVLELKGDTFLNQLD